MTAEASGTPGRQQHALRGILYLCGGVFAFSLHDIAVKWVSGTYPLAEVMFIRSLTALPLMLLLVHYDAGVGALFRGRVGFVFARALILLVAYLLYYMAFAALPFTDAVALYSSVPLIIAALAGPLLGERVGLWRWLAVIIGFAGVIIMLRPGSGVFDPAGVLILICALLYSLGMIMARHMGENVPGSVMAFSTTFIFLIAAAVLWLIFSLVPAGHWTHPSITFLARAWTMPTLRDLFIMMSCGITAAAGVTGLTFAYRETEANLVASFEYTGLVWAALWGFIIWHEIPKFSTLAGAVLIVGAGLVAMAAGHPRWSRRQQPV